MISVKKGGSRLYQSMTPAGAFFHESIEGLCPVREGGVCGAKRPTPFPRYLPRFTCRAALGVLTTLGLMTAAVAQTAVAQTAVAPKPPAYLAVVRTFADSLLRRGLDTYGSRLTAQWASVIDTRTGEVPRRGVPTVDGIRPHDRAVGGSNLYQDLPTVQAFRVLSRLTGDERYARAAEAYLADALRYTTSPATGLMGWGEHLFYDFYEDRVRVDSAFAQRTNGTGGYFHEFLPDTPPWTALWALDSARTAAAIRGLGYHFWQERPTDFRFNRHAHWDRPAYQSPAVSQPWIKHAGLQTYSYLFLYHHTRDPEARRMAEGTSRLYWAARQPETGLTPACLDDPRPEARAANLSGTASLAYFLLKSSPWAPPGWDLAGRAAALLTAAERYCWDADRQTYRVGIDTDGRAVPAASPRTGQTHLTAWVAGYGTANLFEVGRLAAGCARLRPDPVYLRLAERCARLAAREPLPDTLLAENVGDAIHLNVDLYELTRRPEYRQAADRYAALALRHLHRRGWLVRRTGDAYYEAKMGVGTVVAGLLRLAIHQRSATQQKPFQDVDWSK
jgi:hypothetical protein